MIDLPRLFACAAELFNVSDGQIPASRSRSPRMIDCRQAIAYVLRSHQYTVEEIGAMLRRDHTTICYSLKQARRRLTDDPTFAGKVRALAASVDTARIATVHQAVAKRRDAWTVSESVHIALFFWGIACPLAA